MSQRTIDDMISRHIDETRDGLVDCAVNELARGQCTARDYFILKTDICNSTSILRGRRPQTYARIMHTFFATMDAICRDNGADGTQTEYHGDSVLALFPERGNTAEDVVAAAVECHYAFRRLVHDFEDLRSLSVRTRTVLHYGQLSVVKTGPHGESHRVVLGIPIHDAAKREKLLTPGSIWLSEQFGQLFPPNNRAKFLRRQKKSETYTERVLVQPEPKPRGTLSEIGNALNRQPYSALSALGLGNALATRPQPNSALSLASAGRLGDALVPQPRSLLQELMEISTPQYEERQAVREVNDGWTVNLDTAYASLGLPRIPTTANRR